MHFVNEAVLPRNTTKPNRIETICPLNYGIIRHIGIFFPPGCAGLAHVKLYQAGRQIYPSNPEEDYAFDGYAVEIDSYYPLLEKPFKLSIWGWNLDDFFNHTVTFLFTILHPKPVFQPETLPSIESELIDFLYEIEEVEGD